MSGTMAKTAKDRLQKVKSILVSQPKPTDDKSPYFTLAEKCKLKIDFRPFIQVEPVSLKEFRQQKIDILNHTAVIFTSRNAVDHFFKLCAENKGRDSGRHEVFLHLRTNRQLSAKVYCNKKAKNFYRGTYGRRSY